VEKMKNHKEEMFAFIRMYAFVLFLFATTCAALLIIFFSIMTYFNRDENIEEILTPQPIAYDEEKIISKNLIYEKKHEMDGIEHKDLYEIATAEFNSKMFELQCTDDKETWYVEYKDILNRFESYIDVPETVYDVYSDNEIYLIQRAVETETFQCSFDSKVNVASVIFNRLNDGRFGDGVNEVITSPRQFAYGRKVISEDTVLAVEYAFEIEDTTDGCIAFRSDKKPDKWGSWIYSFSDNAIHHFYKEGDK
jgi:hypothetical protein